MSQLENLVTLEKNYDLLDKLNMQLTQLKLGKQVKAEAVKYQQLLNRLTEMEEELSTGKAKLKRSDYVLKEYELKLKELDIELYSGSITNEKQLNFLTNERERINQLLESLETEVLENMELISDIEGELNSVRDKVEGFRVQIDIKKKQMDDNINKLEKAKVQLNTNITNITNLADTNLINNYVKIRQSKGSAVALVENGICSGCHIVVPNYQHDDIKKDKIIHCESCNRILYIPKSP